MKKKLITAVLAVTMAVGMLTGCGSGTGTGKREASGEKLVIWTNMNVEVDTIQKYADEWGEKNGRKVEVIHQSPSVQQFAQAVKSASGPDAVPKKSMRLSIPYMTVPWSWEWHTRILSWMGWLPQSEPIQRLRKNVMIPSLIVRISGSFRRSVVCRIFRLACRSGVLSIRHFLPWPSAGGLPWRLPIRRRNF